MTSWRQFQANRLNALKSTGPRTEEGKRISRRNAVRHGLTAETVIDALEDTEDYRAFEAARPAGAGIGRAGRLGGVARYLVPKPSERADFHGGEACVENPDHALS
jgi:hypothetical protein